MSGGKTTLVLEFEGDAAEELWATSGGVDVRQLLRDALGEFIGLRGGESQGEHRVDEERVLTQYVMERYPEWSERQQRSKAREVCKRKAMAALLKLADFTVEHCPGEDDP
jgi:hypothetical protein